MVQFLLVTMCQFHQHFTHAFCANTLVPKITKLKRNHRKPRKAIKKKKKRAQEMLMKLTPWHILRHPYVSKHPG